MRRDHLLGLLYLNVATLLWGTTFVVIKQSLESLSASQITLARFAVAALCFVPFLLRLERRVWRAGLELGFYLWLGYATQAIGLEYTTASRSAFITTLYVVILPMFLGLIGHKLRLPVWAAAMMAIAGVGLLSYDGSPPNLGDVWTLGTALAYTFYIWRLEHFVAVRSYPTLPITGVQMLGVALLSGLWVAWEGPGWSASGFPYAQMLYLGLVATALCIWLQALGQRTVPAPEAAIAFTLEPVYAAIFAYFLLGERLGVQGLVGGFLILGATLVSQLPQLLRPRKALKTER
ncbi:DMT family transporter [Calidithermus roseus]|uniref:Carboxylate/amino acid/amine transporter n=1 Tax=Calidithermus roseus TaxID=1644118 RepID=A0A399EUA4_9DEIN|nr:EamA family transporter [Calidithermus roseus]RIH87173.1 carboxylate/amino acid/amine transporter [Calidithermus roseus]